MGRNVWKSPNSVPLLAAVHGRIHENMSGNEANDLLEEKKQG
jgi:DhnA family fructose-bisphosphate aldolase class Ia